MNKGEPLQISRRTALKWGALAAATPLLSQLPLEVLADSGESVVIKWNKAALQGVRDSKIGPPMVARALAIVHTCIYDAWAAYDNRAVGTQLGGALRRPARERTVANMNRAISFAAYKACVHLFPGTTSLFDQQMTVLGYDPHDLTSDATTPVGVGKLAADAVLGFRDQDGANQLGDKQGGKPGVAYSDYTSFKARNDPMDLRFLDEEPQAEINEGETEDNNDEDEGVPTCSPHTRPAFDPLTVLKPSEWQPLIYIDGTGSDFKQPFVGAQWQLVTPFALTSASQLRSTGPVTLEGEPKLYKSQARDLLKLSANLNDERKMIAEYWADGPHSELPPGHWDLFAQFVSRRDHHGAGTHGIEADVKLFFALTNAIFDASICCWDNKRAFDGVRPITAIRYLASQKVPGFDLISAWAGPCKGTQVIRGETWLPYQPSTFPTPPFPGYSSGHSTFSAAGAEILRLFTHSDRFGNSVTFHAGSSRTEPGVPAEDVTLHWATFSQAAIEAGLSRRYGGIHFEQDDLDGRTAGRKVALQAWAKAQTYFNGPHNGEDRDDDH